MKTVLITGVNSTLGRYIGKCFLENGWEVIGTGRDFQISDFFKDEKHFTFFSLDLTSVISIDDFFESLFRKVSSVDVLINNAGHVLTGSIEGSSNAQIYHQMQVNFFGPILLTKKMIPHFKSNNSGVFVNLSSIAGLTTFPMFSMYHSSKWALEGFSESLMYELEPFGIKVKLIEPGGIKDNEYQSVVEFSEERLPEYDELLNKVHHTNWFPSFSHPEEIAKVVFDAATDGTNKLRYYVGDDCQMFLKERIRGIMSEESFVKIKQRLNV